MRTLRTIIIMAMAAILSSASYSFAAGDKEKGQSEFKRWCSACHLVLKDKRRVGPSLFKILGKQAGSKKGYKYKKDIVEAGKQGLIWTPETITDYLENPKVFLATFLKKDRARSKMILKLKSLEKRQDIVAYLVSLQPEYKDEKKVEENKKSESDKQAGGNKKEEKK